MEELDGVDKRILGGEWQRYVLNYRAGVFTMAVRLKPSSLKLRCDKGMWLENEARSGKTVSEPFSFSCTDRCEGELCSHKIEVF
jgi:hypothetical protein